MARPTLRDNLERRIDEEIRGGLKCGKEIRDAARVAIDYYELRGLQYIPRREAEEYGDYQRRPKRSLPFTRRVVDLLCSHLYSPGPNRQFEDDGLNKWWSRVSEDNLVNSLWQRADKYATLHGICAFQAARNEDLEHPIKIHLWTRDQFEPFTLPDDSMTVAHVVTIETIDEQTIYKWWSADLIRTYRTKKLGLHQTTAGQTAEFVEEITNVYGLLPFSFVHNDLPVRCFETPGLGNYLAEMNGTLDIEASDMAQAVQCYHMPKGYIFGADADTQIIEKSGDLSRISWINNPDYPSSPPEIRYPQPNLDIEGGWTNVRSAIQVTLEGLGVPETSYRMDQASLPSGAALIAEQAPLADYSKGRQEPFRKYETDLIVMAAQIDGKDVTSSTVGLTLGWPASVITLPGQDRDQQDQDSMQMGLESLVMVTMRRFSITRGQAVAHLKQVSDDNREVESLNLDHESLNPSPFAGQQDRQKQDQQSQSDSNTSNSANDSMDYQD